MKIPLKGRAEIRRMRAACEAAATVLQMIEPHVVPGITTGELDAICRDFILGPLGCGSATVGYTADGSRPPFSGAICTSVNEVVCHGIPGRRVLVKGDILNIDVTVIKDGFFGDTSRMYPVGATSEVARRLVETTRQALNAGIGAVRPGARLGDIGATIQAVAMANGYSVVREFCGHGIGRAFHEPPHVLHYGRRGTGPLLAPGMCFTIEPMLNAGERHVHELSDGWTVVTSDGSLSAQWEHTVLVTPDGVDVLTLASGQSWPEKVAAG